MPLLGFAIAAIAFGGTTVVHDSFSAQLRRWPGEALAVAIAAPALLATLLSASPTGLTLWDTALLAGATAGIAALACVADRRIVLVAVAAVAIIAGAGDGHGLLAAAGAVGVASAAAVLGVRLPAQKALAGGLMAVALLDLRWPTASGARGSFAAAVILAICVSAAHRASRTSRRRVATFAAAAIGFALIACGGAALQALQARTALEAAVDDARAGLGDAQAGRVDDALARFADAEAGFRAAGADLDAWFAQPVKLVPGAAQNHRAMEAIAHAGRDLAAASTDVTSGFDLDDLRLRRGQLDLDAVVAARHKMTDVTGVVETSADALARVASPVLVPVVHDALVRFTDELFDARQSARTTVDVLRVLPDLLGRTGPRRYFLGVQGVSESRATGGIIGSHGVLTADDGRLSLGDLKRTSDLNVVGDVAARSISGPPEYLARYGRYEPERTWQNITMSPDGPSVGSVVAELYPQSGGERVDGVILVDHVAIAALLRLTGPITVERWPEPLTPENIGRILLHEQYLRYPVPDRVDFLADAARGVFDRLTSSDLPGPTAITKELTPAARGRHIVLYSTTPEEQAFFSDLRLNGALRAVSSDFLGLVTQNASGNKIDWFLERSLRYEAQVTPSGDTEAAVTVLLTNAAPAERLPDYVIGGSGPNPSARGANRMTFSLYTPLELAGATINGIELVMRTEREGGRYVHEAFITIPPSSTVTVSLDLRGQLSPKGRYSLDVWAQPMVTPDDVGVRIRPSSGDPIEERFVLRRDRRVVQP